MQVLFSVGYSTHWGMADKMSFPDFCLNNADKDARALSCPKRINSEIFEYPIV